MKFGKKLRATVDNSYEEWRPMFLSYKHLKKCIHPHPPVAPHLTKEPHAPSSPSRSDDADADPDPDTDRAIALSPPPQQPACPGEHMRNLTAVQHAHTAHTRFFSTFRHEVDKVNEFFLDKQEDYIIEHRQLSEKVIEYLVPGRATRIEVNRLRQRLINFHGELVLLENFSTVNYTGFRKILKKHDKKTGTNMRNVYLRTVLVTPFFLSNTVRNIILNTEAQLASLDTIRKFRRPSPASPLALDAPAVATPATSTATATVTAATPAPTSKHASSPADHVSAPLPLAPATLSPCTQVVMEPPRPHAFISPRSALWRLYSEARSFGGVVRDAMAAATHSVPTPPQSLLDLVDDISAIELGLEPAFLSAVKHPSNYCIAGDDTFSIGFFIVTPNTKLQIFKSCHGGAFISKNLRGRARLRVYETVADPHVPERNDATAVSGTPHKKRDFLIEQKRAGLTIGPWPAVPSHSNDMHVEWVPHTLCAIFYVSTPSISADKDRMLCYDAHPVTQTRFRVSSDPDNVVEFVRITC